jgi:hypothetical protein
LDSTEAASKFRGGLCAVEDRKAETHVLDGGKTVVTAAAKNDLRRSSPPKKSSIGGRSAVAAVSLAQLDKAAALHETAVTQHNAQDEVLLFRESVKPLRADNFKDSDTVLAAEKDVGVAVFQANNAAGNLFSLENATNLRQIPLRRRMENEVSQTLFILVNVMAEHFHEIISLKELGPNEVSTN